VQQRLLESWGRGPAPQTLAVRLPACLQTLLQLESHSLLNSQLAKQVDDLDEERKTKYADEIDVPEIREVLSLRIVCCYERGCLSHSRGRDRRTRRSGKRSSAARSAATRRWRNSARWRAARPRATAPTSIST
jgi:hypothetical protein